MGRSPEVGQDGGGLGKVVGQNRRLRSNPRKRRGDCECRVVNKAAQALGRLGGKATSEAKRRAARENWRKAAAALKAKRKAANEKS